MPRLINNRRDILLAAAGVAVRGDAFPDMVLGADTPLCRLWARQPWKE